MSNTDKYDLPVEHPVSSNKESSHPVLETPPHTSDKAVSSSEPQQQAKTSNTNKGLKGSIHYPGVSDESRGRVQEPPEMV